jgi:CHRD domain
MRHRCKLFLGVVPAVSLLLAGCTPSGTAINFKATLDGAQETPAVTTNGTGSGTFTLNAAQTQLSFNITASGLSGPVTAAHFHTGAVGVAGPITFDIFSTVVEANGQVTAQGTWTLSQTDVTNLLAGDIYVNFHTALHSSGEIRGQLIQN